MKSETIKTKAQIQAERVKERAEAAGYTVTLTVTEYDSMITVGLWIVKDTYDDSYSVAWYTRTKGRTTSGFLCCTKFRGYCRSKRVKYNVKLTRKEFFSDLRVIELLVR